MQADALQFTALIKMDWKEFFQPTKRKLILPVLLVLFFLIIMSLNYSFIHKAGVLLCEYNTEYLNPMLRSYFAGDNETAETIAKEGEEYLKQNRPSKIAGVFLEASNGFFERVDPFYAKPCIYVPLGIECKYDYLSKQDIECLESAFKEAHEIRKENVEGYEYEFEEYEHKPIPWYNFILNAIYLIVIGYILSCLIIFISKRKIK